MEKITHQSTTQNLTHSEATTNDAGDMAFQAGPSTHGVTTLVTEAPKVSHVGFTNSIYRGGQIHSDILSYVQRPSLAYSGVFTLSSTSTVQTIPLFPPTYRQLLNSNITGALGFRATFCARLEIVASPQVSGIVKFSYYPLLTPSSVKAIGRPTACQVENVEVNLSEAAAAEIRVPWLNDIDFYTVVAGGFESQYVGLINLVPYLPVQWDSTVTSVPTWAIYCWLEDIEPISRSTPLVVSTPQMGKDPEKVGPVTKFFGAATAVASYAATAIPTISAIARPVSWITGGITALAAYFGWSKPTDGSYMGIMGMSTCRGMNTCADADYAQPMAMYANNEVEPYNLANTDIDEMSLCYLTCKPGLIAQLTIVPTDVSGTVKWSCPVNPVNFIFQHPANGFSQVPAPITGFPPGGTGNKLGFYPSPTAFASFFFGRWRGDLVFRFKFATTKFHAGKVLIGFVPSPDAVNTNSASALAPNPTSRYDYDSILVDLRTTTEVDLVVPYTYPYDWCNVNAYPITMSAAGLVNYPAQNSTGVVFVRIVDALYGPDNVPQNVPVAVEVFSKCGLEFCVPVTPQIVPLPAAGAVIAQMGEDEVNLDIVKRSVGERILSFKQLLMRPEWTYTTNTSGTRSILSAARPTFYELAQFVPGPGSRNDPIPGTSIVALVSSLYSLYRGGMLVRQVPAGTTTSNRGDFQASLTFGPLENIADTRYFPYSLENTMPNYSRLPYYGVTSRMRTVVAGTTNDNLNLTVWTNVGGTDSSYLLGVAAADDFQFGAFSGVPSVVYIDSQTAGNFSSYFKMGAAAPA